MSNLILLSPMNARPLKRASVSQIMCSKINQQSTDDNVGWDVSVVNQPIPLSLNYNTAASSGNGVSVSDLEVSAVPGVLGTGKTWLASKWWSGCKCADLIRAIFAILYQVLGNFCRVFGVMRLGQKYPKIQPPDFQFPSVLRPIIIIQHPR